MDSLVLLGVSFACCVWFLICRRDRLSHVPAVGYTGSIVSWYSSYKFVTNARDVLLEGHKMYKDRVYRIAHPLGWMLIVSSPKYIDELKRTPDDKLSFDDGTRELLKTEYSMGHNIAHNQYHIPILRGKFTRSLGQLFPDIIDEITSSFEDIISTRPGEWVRLSTWNVALRVTSRTTNRVFVGLPLCRSENYSEASLKFNKDVMSALFLFNSFPTVLRRFVNLFYSKLDRNIDHAAKILGPLILERLSLADEDIASLPDDMLSWIILEAAGKERTVRELTRRILALHFLAVHTSTVSFTNAIHELSARPRVAEALREEIEHATQEVGWCKDAVQKMPKLDSFLREAQRMNGISGLSMARIALVDHTLSDGTFIPKGTMIQASNIGVHYDPEIYPDPHTFDPWRFVNAQANKNERTEEDNEPSTTGQQFVTTSPEYVPFGYGRHACPGRFFAGIELKAMMAHLIMNYEVRSEVDGVAPKPEWVAEGIHPSPKILTRFRRRVQRD